MKRFVVCDPASGEIEVHGVCASDEEVELQAVKGKLLIRVDEDVTPITHYLRDGRLVRYTDPQAREKSTRPSVFCAWSNETFSWVDRRSEEQVLELLRAVALEKRRDMLSSSDWTETPSARGRLGEDLYGAWQTYRQALRDITNQPGFPHDIAWPVPPQ